MKKLSEIQQNSQITGFCFILQSVFIDTTIKLIYQTENTIH